MADKIHPCIGLAVISFKCERGPAVVVYSFRRLLFARWTRQGRVTYCNNCKAAQTGFADFARDAATRGASGEGSIADWAWAKSPIAPRQIGWSDSTIPVPKALG